MSDSDGEKKKFSAGTIVFWLAVVCGVGYFVVPGIINPPKDPLIEGLKDPETALRTYQNTAYGFTKNTPGCGFMEVEKIVTIADWGWYEANYQDVKKYDTVGAMREDVLDVIDPTQGAVIDKRIGLNVIILSGCYSPGSKIMSKDIQAAEAFIVCRTEDLQTKSQTDWKIRLVKEGDLWKVTGFALGIANLTRNTQPGDIVVSDWDPHAAKIEQVAEDMGGATPAKPDKKPAAEPAESSGDSPLDLLGSAEESGDEAASTADSASADEDPFGVTASTNAESESPEAADEEVAKETEETSILDAMTSDDSAEMDEEIEVASANASPSASAKTVREPAEFAKIEAGVDAASQDPFGRGENAPVAKSRLVTSAKTATSEPAKVEGAEEASTDLTSALADAASGSEETAESGTDTPADAKPVEDATQKPETDTATAEDETNPLDSITDNTSTTKEATESATPAKAQGKPAGSIRKADGSIDSEAAREMFMKQIQKKGGLPGQKGKAPAATKVEPAEESPEESGATDLLESASSANAESDDMSEEKPSADGEATQPTKNKEEDQADEDPFGDVAGEATPASKPAASAPKSAAAKPANGATKPTASKPAPPANTRPDPASLVGGSTTKVKVDPALLAPADALISQAAKDWNAAKYKQAVANGEKALKIYLMHLGEDHPKITKVRKMIEDAKAKAEAP